MISAAKIGLQLIIAVILCSCFYMPVSAQISDIAPGTSVFVLRKPKKLFGNTVSGSNATKKITPKPSMTPKPAVTKKTGIKKPIAVEPIPGEEWINMQADAAIEERKISDEEPFLSLSNGFLNSRVYFCESPQFPDEARRNKQKQVNSKTLVTIGKYGGVLSARTIEDVPTFRSNVYQTFGSMQFRQSYFMGQPVRIEGLVNFTQNPANSILCRETSQEVEIPAIIDGGILNEYLQGCKALQFPAQEKTSQLTSVEAKVQVLVDEQGNVIEGRLISSNSTFGEIARQQALKAKFRKSLIAGKAVKVRGELVFIQNSNNDVPCNISLDQK